LQQNQFFSSGVQNDILPNVQYVPGTEDTSVPLKFQNLPHENVGVQPEIQSSYQTTQNLTQENQPYSTEGLNYTQSGFNKPLVQNVPLSQQNIPQQQGFQQQGFQQQQGFKGNNVVQETIPLESQNIQGQKLPPQTQQNLNQNKNVQL